MTPRRDCVRILGLDPGLAHFGWALVEVRRGKLRVVRMGVVVTKKSDKKLHVLHSDDGARRAKECYRVLAPLAAESSLVANESMSFVRSATTMAQVGRAFGVKDAIVEARGLPSVEVSPQQIKLAVCGAKDASKDEIQTALDALFGGDLAARYLPSLAQGFHEHPYDALGAVVASISSDVVRAVLASAA